VRKREKLQRTHAGGSECLLGRARLCLPETILWQEQRRQGAQVLGLVQIGARTKFFLSLPTRTVSPVSQQWTWRANSDTPWHAPLFVVRDEDLQVHTYMSLEAASIT
jgi:hypothetical protein